MNPSEIWDRAISGIDFSNPIHVVGWTVVLGFTIAVAAACCFEFNDWRDGL